MGLDILRAAKLQVGDMSTHRARAVHSAMKGMEVVPQRCHLSISACDKTSPSPLEAFNWVKTVVVYV